MGHGIGAWKPENLCRHSNRFGPEGDTAYATRLNPPSGTITRLGPDLPGAQEAGDPRAADLGDAV
ncbi:hypothetical protein [Streptomyces sp. NPDC097981]|uniref:hypothetical protein n=1 Tax=Streptomyces sp. NPDC097981 TaxID=3155428 RepID=UPI0033232F89